MQESTYDELVSLIYDCVLDECAWLRLLGRLAVVTGHREGTLLFWDRHGDVGPQISAISLCSPELQRSYDSDYGRLDPTQRFMLGRRVGDWYHDVHEYGKESMARDPFYQEFFRDHGLQSTSSIKLYEQDGAAAYLSLLTALDAPAPSDAQRAMVARLARHLQQAAGMSSSIRRLELGLAQRELLLEQSATAQWLVEANGRVVLCNGVAERRMGEVLFPLRMRQGRLFADAIPKLAVTIRMACGRDGPARAGWLRLPEAGAEVLITPVKSEERFTLEHQPSLALVALLENRPRVELLAELFRFTGAESRLAELIAQGLSPEDCAGRLGVSINTVRSQLRSLFGKTDTTRQSELVGLLTRVR
ncbi:helix-turn-helix transcriptional regulator [Pseudomonas berkeleyensis]|uniref:Helix-turn-helix transcriptional regulator n=1 Tax=Pseudomonas berkeleyensis TaxID=2726956 RepID=A0A7G5DQR2_9PSED|nr:helix-turn-helix transcriptional regulator [Pseudomonas berkeleyensis]QMV64087.1 helix-turn-helix transcriptional regulator [Pseudomonas berkeleyensis]WSO39554.1 helix-turn-helix transcriptional regulator [Pseudomonas berkeleyensis]